MKNKKLKSEKKSRARRVIKALLIAALSLVLLAAASFYVLIVLGASPSLQEAWINTAMHTYRHQYLATWFFSDEKIAEVTSRGALSDAGRSSVIRHSVYDNSGKEDQYIAEGYRKLSDGVFLKDVSGKSAGVAWRGYCMLVSDPTRVRLADTASQGKHGSTVMRMVDESGALGGINGGGFIDGPEYDSDAGLPSGLLIKNGELISPGVDDPEVFHIIGFNENGELILRQETARWALENGLVDALSFSPYIVVNGEGLVKEGSGGWGIAPRTGIAQRESGEVLLIVIDGRQFGHSMGADLDGLQEIMLSEGALNGAMMDGGSSSVMVWGGDYVSRPSLGRERWVNNCWVVSGEQ